MGERFGVILDPFGMPHHKTLEVFNLQSLPRQQAFHGARPPQRQIPFEQNPVKTGDDTMDPAGKLIDELLHGALLQMAV